jgi:CheY-like chemotaxis protein
VQRDAPERLATILVVDDGPPNVKLLEMLLHAEGYATVAATSGGAALRLALTEQPDLILLDAMMPDLDGFETAVMLKADARTRAIPVIMITALDDQESRRRALQAGADAFLPKPVDRALLRARIPELLHAGRVGEARRA